MLEALTEGEVIRVNVTNILIVEEGQEDRRAASDVMLVVRCSCGSLLTESDASHASNFQLSPVNLRQHFIASSPQQCTAARMQQITNILI